MAIDRKKLPLDQIRTDGDTQPRCEMNADAVAEYAEVYRGPDADDIPDLDVMFDGESYWLFSGFHRKKAAGEAGLAELWVVVHRGTLEDARWAALATNKTHGMRRTNADKRRAVELAMKQRPKLSNNSIAHHVGVSLSLVNDVRRALNDSLSGDGERVGKDGRTTDTSKIGKSRTKKPKADGEEKPRPTPAERQAQAEAVIKQWSGAEPGQTSDDVLSGEEDPTPSQPPPPKAPPAKDAWGIPVQPHAAEAFALAHRFDELVSRLKECARDLGDLVETPAGKHLIKTVQWVKSGNKAGGRWVMSYLDNAIRTVENSRPRVTDCPYAFNDQGAHPENCPLCHSARWLGSPKGHQIPPQLTEAMKKHYGVAGGGE